MSSTLVTLQIQLIKINRKTDLPQHIHHPRNLLTQEKLLVHLEFQLDDEILHT